MTNGCFRNGGELSLTRSFPAPAEGLAFVILQVRELEGVQALPERDQARSEEGGMGTVVVHDLFTVDVQDRPVVTRQGELPETVGRNVDEAGEYITEVVLVRGSFDGRLRHRPAAHDGRSQDIGRAGEGAQMVGVGATRLRIPDRPGLPVHDREDMDPESTAGLQTLLECFRGKDAVLVLKVERTFIQGRCFRGLRAVQGVADGRTLRPAGQRNRQDFLVEARIADEGRRGNDKPVGQGIRSRKGVASMVRRRGKGEG